MTPSSAAALVSSASEAGVRITSSLLPLTICSTRLVTVTGNASLPRRPLVPIRRRKSSSACSTGISRACSVERDAEVGADRVDEAFCLADRLPERGRSLRALLREAVRADRLDADRAEDERQHERGRGVAVVDDDPEAARLDGPPVQRREQVLGVALADPCRIGHAADGVERGTSQLVAREVLLDLLLEPGGELNSRLLVEADLEHLGIGVADADVEARVVAVGLQQVPADRRREHAQVGDVDSSRVEAGDHRALDQPAGGGRLTARDYARTPLQGGAE